MKPLRLKKELKLKKNFIKYMYLTFEEKHGDYYPRNAQYFATDENSKRYFDLYHKIASKGVRNYITRLSIDKIIKPKMEDYLKANAIKRTENDSYSQYITCLKEQFHFKDCYIRILGKGIESELANREIIDAEEGDRIDTLLKKMFAIQQKKEAYSLATREMENYSYAITPEQYYAIQKAVGELKALKKFLQTIMESELFAT